MKKMFAILAMMFTFPVMALAEPNVLDFCGGGEGGFYERLAKTIGGEVANKTGSKLNVHTTGGSVENSEKMSDGDCDIAVIQADAVASLPLPTDIKVTDAHTEAVYWIFGKTGVSDFGDMESGDKAKRYALATVSGSGGEVTLKNFIKTDSDYEDVRTVEFEDWYGAAEAVAQGYTMKAGVRIEIAGMIYVSRPGAISTDITEDFGDQLTIGEISDDSFASAKDVNDNALYVHCPIQSKDTSGVRTSTLLSPDTYCLKAQIVYNNEYHKGLSQKEARVVRRSVDKSINSVLKALRQG